MLSIISSNLCTCIQFLKYDVANVWNWIFQLWLKHDYKPRANSILCIIFSCREQKKPTFCLIPSAQTFACKYLLQLILKSHNTDFQVIQKDIFAGNGHHQYLDHRRIKLVQFEAFLLFWTMNSQDRNIFTSKIYYSLNTNLVSPSILKTVSKVILREENIIEFDFFVTENFLIQTGPSFKPENNQ